jgi:hypothetical protein
MNRNTCLVALVVTAMLHQTTSYKAISSISSIFSRKLFRVNNGHSFQYKLFSSVKKTEYQYLEILDVDGVKRKVTLLTLILTLFPLTLTLFPLT